MAKSTALLLLAFSSLVPTVVSVPILAPEECVCQPLEDQAFSNSSLASCNKIAEDIQQWRAVAFHSPYLADAFVDTEQGLRISRDGRPLEKTQVARRSGCHSRVIPQTAFDKAVRKLFRQWKKPSEGKTMARPSLSTETQTEGHLLDPTRPTWPWEHAEVDDKSLGRIVEQTPAPAFLEPAQRYRILCRSRTTQSEYSFAQRPEIMLLVGLILVVICMTIFDMAVVAWRGYKWATQCSPVTLGGDEKQIYAYEIKEKTFDDTVVPAISDL